LPHRGTGIFDRGRASRRAIRLALAFAVSLIALPAMAADHGQSKPPKGEVAVEGPTFVKLPPIVLPVFDSQNKVTRQAGLVLALELNPGKTEADVEPNRRKLYDAFITDLYTLYDQTGGAGRVIEPGLIKQRLQETSDRVLGPGIVHEVLIQQAFERARR
jgi:flagellar FliL protein